MPPTEVSLSLSLSLSLFLCLSLYLSVSFSDEYFVNEIIIYITQLPTAVEIGITLLFFLRELLQLLQFSPALPSRCQQIVHLDVASWNKLQQPVYNKAPECQEVVIPCRRLRIYNHAVSYNIRGGDLGGLGGRSPQI